jgi:hypothetical protein
MKIPQSLNALCHEWSSWLKAIPISISIDDALHISESQSIYEMHIDLVRPSGVERFYYVGRTASPKNRAAKHKSAFVNCHVSTVVGMSALYTPELLGDVTHIMMNFTIIKTGLTLPDAKNAEKERSTELRLLHNDAVLTRPNGARQITLCAVS